MSGPAAGRLRFALLAAVSAVVLGAPLAFGSVTPRASSALTLGCLLVGGLWIVWRTARGWPALPVSEPLLLLGLLALALGLLQLIPLPGSLLTRLSPAAAELRSLYEPPDLSTLRPLSVYPYATARAILRGLGFLLLAGAAMDIARERSGRWLLGGVLILSGGFQAFYGLMEYLSGRQHIFGFAKNVNTAVATGTFINPNHHAGYLEMVLPMGIAGLILAARARPRAGSVAARDRVTFGGATAAVLVLGMVTAVVASGSRMGLLAVVGSLLALGALSKSLPGGRGFGVAVLVVSLALAGLVAHGRGRYMVTRFIHSADQFQSTMGRMNMWEQSAGVGERFRLTGTGLGTFPEIMPAFQVGGDGRILRHAHNDYLEWLAEIGLPGAFLLLLGLILVLRSVSRSVDWRQIATLGAVGGLIALGLHSWFDFNLAIPSNALTALVLLGLLVGAGRGPGAPANPPPGAGWVRWCVCGLLLFSLAVTAIPTLAPWMPLPREAEAPIAPEEAPWYVRLADCGGPRRLFARARHLHAAALGDFQTLLQGARRDRPPSREAILYLQARLDRAERLQEAALLRRPTSARGHLDLGLMRASSCSADSVLDGQPRSCASEAFREIRLALALQPAAAPLHATAARFLLAVWGDLSSAEREESREYVERAIRFQPEDQALRETWERFRVPG